MDTLLRDLQPGFHAALGAATVIYALGVLWFARGIRPQHPEGGAAPVVSVVVAARDEEARIDACLDGLLAQTHPACEVIVVDDGSADRTAARVRARQAGGAQLRLLQGQGAGKKAALSLGIAAARGEFILTTDADCRVPATWAAGMAACFAEGVGMVVGFSQIGQPRAVRHWRAGWEGVDFLNLMAGALGSVGQGRALAASGQNLAFRKAAFAQVGGYGRILHRASGDDVLLLQLIRRSWRIAFSTAPETFVIHPPSPSWRGLLRQRIRWASNAPLQARLNPGFFCYLVAVFSMNLLLALSPLLVLAGGLHPGWAGMAWGMKSLAEWALFQRAARLFGRLDLGRYFPLWTLSQPFYLVLVGVLGSLGWFQWKGRGHRWGRNEEGRLTVEGTPLIKS